MYLCGSIDACFCADVFLCVCLSVSVWFRGCVFMYFGVDMCMYLCGYTSEGVCLCVDMYVSLVSVLICVYFCVSIDLCVCLFLCRYVGVFFHVLMSF